MTKEAVIRNYLDENGVIIPCNTCGRMLPISSFNKDVETLLNSKPTCKDCINEITMSNTSEFKQFESDLNNFITDNSNFMGNNSDLILKTIKYMVLHPNYVLVDEDNIGLVDLVDYYLTEVDKIKDNHVVTKKECTDQRRELHIRIAMELNRPDLIPNGRGGSRTKSEVVEPSIELVIPVEKATKYQHITKSVDPNPNNISIDLKDRIAQNAPGAKETPVAYKPSEEDTVALLGGEQALELAQEMYDEAVVRKLKIAERKKEFSNYIKDFNSSLTIQQLQKTNELIEQDPSISDTEILNKIAKLI